MGMDVDKARGDDSPAQVHHLHIWLHPDLAGDFFDFSAAKEDVLFSHQKAFAFVQQFTAGEKNTIHKIKPSFPYDHMK